MLIGHFVLQEVDDYDPRPVLKLNSRGLNAHLLLREEGTMPRPGGYHRIRYPMCGMLP